MKRSQRVALSHTLHEVGDLALTGMPVAKAIAISEGATPATNATAAALVARLGPAAEAFVHAHTAAGTEAPALCFLGEELGRDRRLHSGVVLVISDIVVLVALLFFASLFLVPQATEMFASFGADLPIETRLLLAVGPWLWPFALAIAIVLAVLMAWLSPRTRGWKLPFWHALDRRMLRVPGVRRLVQEDATAEIARWLAHRPAGLSLFALLAALRAVSVRPFTARLVERIEQRLAAGEPLSAALAGSAGVRPALVAAVRDTESSGTETAPETFQAIAAATARRGGGDWQRFVLLCHIAVAVVVAFVVLSIYSPIFKLGSVV